MKKVKKQSPLSRSEPHWNQEGIPFLLQCLSKAVVTESKLVLLAAQQANK